MTSPNTLESKECECVEEPMGPAGRPCSWLVTRVGCRLGSDGRWRLCPGTPASILSRGRDASLGLQKITWYSLETTAQHSVLPLPSWRQRLWTLQGSVAFWDKGFLKLKIHIYLYFIKEGYVPHIPWPSSEILRLFHVWPYLQYFEMLHPKGHLQLQ